MYDCCDQILILTTITWQYKMLKFVLLVNKQGQTRLSQYYEYVPVEERVTTEADIVRKCLARSEDSVSFHSHYKRSTHNLELHVCTSINKFL